MLRLAGMLMCLTVLATAGCRRAPRPLPDTGGETPAHVLATLLAVDESAVEVMAEPPGAHNVGIWFRARAGGETYAMGSSGTTQWFVIREGWDKPEPGNVAGKKALAIATTLARRRFGATLDRMEEPTCYGFDTEFSWVEMAGPEAMTGNRVEVDVCPSGKLYHYVEERARRVVRREDVRISRDVAITLCTRRKKSGLGPEYGIIDSDVHLALSSYLSADGGPVWMVTYYVAPSPWDGQGDKVNMHWMYLDAMTGRELQENGPGGPVPGD
jgi:hypothetical protein